MNITWDPPTDNGGSTSITYTLMFGESRNNLTPAADNISRTWFQIDGLTNGKLYFITIFSWNEIGPCEAGANIEGVPMTLPSPPTNLNITWQKNYVLVKWDPPADDGGSDVWLYYIFRGPDPGNMTKIKEIQGSYLSYMDEDVSSEEDYYYHIICETSLGRSAPSEKFFLEHPSDEKKELDLRLPVIAGSGILILILIIIGTIMIVRNRRKDWGIEE